MTIQNPFATPAGAWRYHKGRPPHHGRALQKILSVTRQRSIRRALDVGCGTGLSTVALARHADVVIGLDPVEAMLRLAPRRQNMFYARAAAESVPLAPSVVDLVTVSSGIHWFDQDAFFNEVERVLVADGWLAIYDHFFTGSRDDRAINEWLKESYGNRYPPPARGPSADNEIALPPTFVEIDAFEYDDLINFTHDQLVAYLMSHSNTIAPASEGRERPEETANWLQTETMQWFKPLPLRTFLFRGAVRCLRLHQK